MPNAYTDVIPKLFHFSHYLSHSAVADMDVSHYFTSFALRVSAGYIITIRLKSPDETSDETAAAEQLLLSVDIKRLLRCSP